MLLLDLPISAARFVACVGVRGVWGGDGVDTLQCNLTKRVLFLGNTLTLPFILVSSGTHFKVKVDTGVQI